MVESRGAKYCPGSMGNAAWATTTAGASWTWTDLGFNEWDPYRSTQTFNTYPNTSRAVDVLSNIMTTTLSAFFRTRPSDERLAQPVPPLTFCLAEPGHQYLVYSDSGRAFALNLSATAACHVFDLTWHDPLNGKTTYIWRSAERGAS